MSRAGVIVAGVLEEVLARADVVVDATPKHVAGGNVPRYRATGVKAVLQGSESHDTMGQSFVAQANDDSALGRDMPLVVSCNTTSIVRIHGTRCASGRGPGGQGPRRLYPPCDGPLGIPVGRNMDTMDPEPKIPSH